MCFFMCAVLNQSSLVSADNSLLLHLISIQTLFVSPCSCAWITFCACFPVVRDHPAVIKRRFTSVLIVSGLSPLFVWAWRESAGVVVSRDLVPVSQDEHFVLRCITVSVFICVSEWSVFAGSHGNPV